MLYTSATDPWENRGLTAGIVEKVALDKRHGSWRILVAHVRLNNDEQIRIKLDPKEFVREGTNVKVNIVHNSKTDDYKYNLVWKASAN